jgi:RHS repeat-associated protein
LIRWLPTTAQAGNHDVVIRVTDQAGNETTQAFTLLVSIETPNRAPTISSRPILGATIGREYSYTVVARDPDGDPLSFALSSAPSGMTIDTSGQITWTPSAPAQTTVTIEVTDARGGIAVQSYTITARANQAPIVEPIPNATAALQGTFRTVVRATDPEGDALTFSLVQAPAGMTIDNEGRISWTPTGNPRTEVVRVQVADTSGLSASTEFTLSLILDNEAPRVNLTLSRTTVQFGTSVQVHVTATDNVGIGSLHLTVTQNGITSEVPLNASGIATFTPPGLGRYTFTATATDTTGNTATATADLFASDPNAQSDVRSSFTRLEMLTAPETYQTFAPSDDTGDPIPELSYLTDVYGTIESVGQPLAYWRLLMARGGEVDIFNVDPNDPAWQVIGSGESLVTDGKLGTFDPTMLPNDSYVLALVAYDVTGSGWMQPSLVSVTGNAKLGDFRLEFTDLTLPLNGIPITINRIYDTKDSRTSGDFGYGWSLGVRDAKIRETVSASEQFIPGRTKVYLTAPDGNRVGFTYHEVNPQGSWFGTIWRAEFRSDAGHNYKLTIPDTTVTRGGILGALGGEGINPSYYILTTPDGTKYEYDQATGLKKISDTNGNTVTFTPNAITHSGGRVISLERDGSGRITAIRLPDGNVGVRYRYNAAGDLIEVKQITQTTPNEQALTSTITYRTDRAHYLDEYTDANGNRAVKTVYDASSRLVGVTDANGNTASQEFDPANFTETVRDARGNPTHITYNERGNVTRSVQPTEFGDIVLEYEYADPNNPDKETKIINGRGYVTTRSHDASGNLLAETTPDGTTSYQYNSLNKLTQVTDTLGRVTAYGYDLVGNLIRVVTPNGEASSFTYDNLGRVATFTDFAGNITTFTDYCSCGRPLTIINPDGSIRTSESNQYSQVTMSVDERGFVTRNEYDNQGRLIKVIDGEGNATRYEYTGANQTKVIDALGNVTRYEYDALNRRTKIIDAEGGIVSFTYDANGNQETVIDPVGNVTRFKYDAANRVKEEIDPLGKSKFFEYDAAGNKVETTDRNGRVRQFDYDGMNRQTAELWLDATGSTIRTITSEFDSAGNLLRTADPDAVLSYTYDGLNRMTTATTNYPGTNVAPFTLFYAYDSNGNVTSVTDNTGVVVASTYDNRNRLDTRTWSGGGIDAASVKYTYFANSQVDTLTRYADITQTNKVGQSSYTYLENGLTESITHKDGTGAVLAGYVYTYNPAGLLTLETHHGDTYNYGYDKTNQLLTVNKNGSLFESFSYDANGNRKTSTGPNGNQTYAPAGPGNQLLNDGLFAYTYDNEGNLQTKTELATGNMTTYTWDHRNRLTKVEERTAGGIIVSVSEYAYDPIGRRILQKVNGHSLYTVYDGEHAWSDVKDGAVVARYLFGNKIDNILARWKPNSGTAWYLGDKLGTIRDLVNATGTTINQIDYSAFGQILGQTSAAVDNRYTFTGRERDNAIGDYYYRARYYSSSVGKFTQFDPIGFASGDFNNYRYVLNRPNAATDAYGTNVLFEQALIAGLEVIVLNAAVVSACSIYNGDGEANPFTSGGVGSPIAFGVIATIFVYLELRRGRFIQAAEIVEVLKVGGSIEDILQCQLTE